MRWTRATPLLSCSIYGERTIDQPAAPALVRRGSEIWFYMHEEVPGITIDRMTPRLAYSHFVKAEKASVVVRYAFACDMLSQWTAAALKEWTSEYAASKTSSASRFKFIDSCPRSGADISASATHPTHACKWDARTLDTSHSELPRMQPKPRRPYTLKLHKKKPSQVGV